MGQESTKKQTTSTSQKKVTKSSAARASKAATPLPSQQMRRPTQKQSASVVPKLLLNGLAIFVVGFAGGWVAFQTQESPTTSVSSEAGERVVLQESQLISSIAEDVGQSVVSINVETTETGFFGGTFQSGGAGTGIIISADGFVLTNKHVIPESATSVSVVSSDGTQYDNVAVVGRDPFTDIAYLKINDVDDLVPARLGDSEAVKVGQKVVAIGNALGEFSNTVTSGIISGLSRPIVAGDGTQASDSLQNLFQTDASINPGNSGGPLVNASGEVIGINTAVAGNAENIGFAIPLNDIIGGLETVLESGELIKPYLGVRYITLNAEVAESLNLPVENGVYLDASIENGAAVVPGSPAEKAGLEAGDIIVSANGRELNDDASLATLVGGFKVGETLSLSVNRDGEILEIDVVLERVPDELAG